MHKRYVFIRLDWNKAVKMSEKLNEALMKLDEAKESDCTVHEVESVSALEDEVLVLVSTQVG